jgi:integration host factor subunit beta
MTKTELIEALSNKAGLTRSKGKEIVKVFFGEISNALANNDRVEIRGFGSFKVKHYDGYAGKNLRQANLSRSSPRGCLFSNVVTSL